MRSNKTSQTRKSQQEMQKRKRIEHLPNQGLHSRQRSPGRGEKTCKQKKPHGPRLRVQRIVIPRCRAPRLRSQIPSTRSMY